LSNEVIAKNGHRDSLRSTQWLQGDDTALQSSTSTRHNVAFPRRLIVDDMSMHAASYVNAWCWPRNHEAGSPWQYLSMYGTSRRDTALWADSWRVQFQHDTSLSLSVRELIKLICEKDPYDTLTGRQPDFYPGANRVAW